MSKYRPQSGFLAASEAGTADDLRPDPAALLAALAAGSERPAGELLGRKARRIEIFDDPAGAATGLSWPIRIFAVSGPGFFDSQGTRWLRSATVQSEVPADDVFGPRGAQVVALLNQLGELEGHQRRMLGQLEGRIEASVANLADLQLDDDFGFVMGYLRIRAQVLQRLDGDPALRGAAERAGAALAGVVRAGEAQAAEAAGRPSRPLPPLSDLSSIVVAGIADDLAEQVYDFWDVPSPTEVRIRRAGGVPIRKAAPRSPRFPDSYERLLSEEPGFANVPAGSVAGLPIAPMGEALATTGPVAGPACDAGGITTTENLEEPAGADLPPRLEGPALTPGAAGTEQDVFLINATIEAHAQRVRWSAADVNKSDAEWFWQVGYLTSKGMHDVNGGRLTHLTAAAATLANWHFAAIARGEHLA